MVGKLFQDELNWLKDSGKGYARRNPRLEKYLGESSTDPDVERLIQGFAWMTARVRECVEDELTELTEPLIRMLGASFLRPFPPVTIMKFSPVQKSITERQMIPRGTYYEAKLPDGSQCTFRTAADCAVYPLELGHLRLERSRDRSVLELQFATLSGLPLSKIKLDALRLQFGGEHDVAWMLYLWTNRYVKRAKIRVQRNEPVPDARPTEDVRTIDVPLEQIRPGGFATNEALLDLDGPAHFEGYRLLREFYTFQDKFHCVDITGLGRLLRNVEASTFSLVIEYDRPLPADYKIEQDSIQLYCVPAINLFPAKAMPLSIGDETNDHPVTALSETRRRYEIFDITGVTGADSTGDPRDHTGARRYQKYESLTHKVELSSARQAVYYKHQERTELGEPGWRHSVAFVGHDGKPAVPKDSSIAIDLACFDAEAGELPIGAEWERSSKSPSFATFTNITVPTAPVYPPIDGSLNWRLISNLSLNYISLKDPKAFASIISVYDYQAFSDRQAERAMEKRAAGIVDLKTTPIDRLFSGRPVRGLKSTMRMRESNFANDGEMFLFASIIAEFIVLYATTNSFVQLEVVGVEKNQTWMWPAKTGLQPLI